MIQSYLSVTMHGDNICYYRTTPIDSINGKEHKTKLKSSRIYLTSQQDPYIPLVNNSL